ncbi:response regulator transcription factor, partial [bacterium]|nr:response regulator transcription factor [bacterium]
MSEKRIKIMLVEDQKLMRVGIKSLFEDSENMEIIKETETAKEAIECARILKPDVVLMDIGLPDMSGIEAAKKILSDNKKIKIIMLTSHTTEKEVMDSLMAGASAYIMKDFDTESFLMIVKTVNDGAMWLDPQVVPYIREKNSGIIPAKQVTRAAFREQHSNLTQREYEVLKLVVD